MYNKTPTLTHQSPLYSIKRENTLHRESTFHVHSNNALLCNTCVVEKRLVFIIVMWKREKSQIL